MSHPNAEPDQILECGCIGTLAFAVRVLGERWTKGPLKGKRVYRNECQNGHGIQRIIRPATLADRIRNWDAVDDRLF